MGAPEKFEPEEVAAALHDKKGMVTLAAEQLGCDRSTVYRYINEYDIVAEAHDHEDEKVNDVTELKLIEAIQNGEAWAIRFRLQQKEGTGYDEVERVKQAIEHGASDDVDEFLDEVLGWDDK